MAEGHQSVLSVPWYGEKAYQVLLLAVGQAAVAADCAFVLPVCLWYSLSVKCCLMLWHMSQLLLVWSIAK